MSVLETAMARQIETSAQLAQLAERSFQFQEQLAQSSSEIKSTLQQNSAKLDRVLEVRGNHNYISQRYYIAKNIKMNQDITEIML